MQNLCLNARCPKPNNLETQLFCQACGSELLLAGRYRVLSELGGGGFGKTYAVMAAHQPEEMVLKVLINAQPKAVELFQREAQVLSQLNHPGIPKVESDGYFTYFPRDAQEPMHCLVMEKIEGMDLADYMKHRGNRPIEEAIAIRWLEEIVSILDEVHRQQFFHRDIKPANIMLRANGPLALIDFGTVRQISATYVAKQGMGQVTGVVSAGYTAPEQFNGQAVLQSDFYALARTFVFLLTGKEPSDLYDAYQDAVIWRDLAPDITVELADLIDAMMARSLGDRPQAAQEVLLRIRQLKDGGQTVSLPSPISEAQNQVVSTIVQPTPLMETGPVQNSATDPIVNKIDSTILAVPEVSEGLPAAPSKNSGLQTRSAQTKFFGQWLFATTISAIIYIFISFIPFYNYFYISWYIYGIVSSLTQWFVLRRYVSKCWMWIPTTIVYFLLIAFWLDSGVDYLLSVAISSFLLGFSQCWILKRNSRIFWWWIPIAGCAFFLSVFFTLPLQLYRLADVYLTGSHALYGLLGGLVWGLISGIGLVWLLNHSKHDENREDSMIHETSR